MIQEIRFVAILYAKRKRLYESFTKNGRGYLEIFSMNTTMQNQEPFFRIRNPDQIIKFLRLESVLEKLAHALT